MTKAAGARMVRLALGLLAVMVGGSASEAHSLHLFAEGEGTVIRGRAYFHGGSPVHDAQVIAFDPEGRKLGETRTDEQGAFTLVARYRCDHRLLVATDDGHGAEFRVAAEELSAALPPLGAADAAATCDAADAAWPTGSAAAERPPPDDAGSVTDQLAALRSQLASLREQVTEYEHRTRLRDVVGGIGYILGLAGVAFYVAARRAERVAKS